MYMRRAKFGNKKTVIHGIKFDSKKESDRYLDLLLLEKGGEIKELKLQPKFPIIINGITVFNYKADFEYIDKGQRIIEDVKGFKTPMYNLKKKCVEAYYNFKIKET